MPWLDIHRRAFAPRRRQQAAQNQLTWPRDSGALGAGASHANQRAAASQRRSRRLLSACESQQAALSCRRGSGFERVGRRASQPAKSVARQLELGVIGAGRSVKPLLKVERRLWSHSNPSLTVKSLFSSILKRWPRHRSDLSVQVHACRSQDQTRPLPPPTPTPKKAPHSPAIF